MPVHRIRGSYPIQALPPLPNVRSLRIALAMLARVSDAYRQQYRTSRYLTPLLHQETVPTTLRLEPM